MKASAEIRPDGLVVRWFSSDKDEWNAMLKRIQSLPMSERKFSDKTRTWSVTDNPANRERLIGWGFSGLGAPAPVTLSLPTAPVRAEPVPVVEPPAWINAPLPEGVHPEARQCQKEALQFLIHRGGRGIIGDEMGVGKTAEALFWLDTQPQLRPAVIVTTASTKFQWVAQAKKWAPRLRFRICSGQRPNLDHYSDDVVYVINWDILTYWQKWFKEVVKPAAIIGDEVQAISNSASKRAKAFCHVAEGCQSIIPMSGTPIQTKPAQFFTVLHLIDPQTFPNQYAFLNRYCDPKHNGFSMTYDGATNVQELHRKVQPLMIRRLKKDVMDLPEKVYNPILLDCVISKEYQDARDRVLALQGVPVAQLKQEIQGLALSAFKVKEQAVLQWIEDFLTSGEKLVVFAWHLSVVALIQASLGRRCVVVNGSVTGEDRERAKQAFRTDPKVQVFLGNIQAAGEGIDGLQDVCSNMAYVELSGVPGRMMQSEDRLHRGGQRNSVSINYLLAPGTIDEAFLSILDQRRTKINQIMDGVEDVNGESAVMDVWLQLKKGN